MPIAVGIVVVAPATDVVGATGVPVLAGWSTDTLAVLPGFAAVVVTVTVATYSWWCAVVMALEVAVVGVSTVSVVPVPGSLSTTVNEV